MADKGEGKVTPLRPPRPCPECGKPSARATYPFCSQRCKAIPATEDDEDPEGSDGAPAKS
jgi:hypothetical protein